MESKKTLNLYCTALRDAKGRWGADYILFAAKYIKSLSSQGNKEPIGSIIYKWITLGIQAKYSIFKNDNINVDKTLKNLCYIEGYFISKLICELCNKGMAVDETYHNNELIIQQLYQQNIENGHKPSIYSKSHVVLQENAL